MFRCFSREATKAVSCGRQPAGIDRSGSEPRSGVSKLLRPVLLSPLHGYQFRLYCFLGLTPKAIRSRRFATFGYGFV